MRTEKKYKNTILGNIGKVLIEHINCNLKDYLVLSIIFIIGVMIGVIIINNSSVQSKTEISGYINSFIDTIHDNQFQIDKSKLIQLSIVENVKIVAIIWIAGSTLIGIPLIYIITSYKGFCIGYTISAIISSLGIGKRDNFFVGSVVFTKHYCYSDYSNVKCQCIKII